MKHTLLIASMMVVVSLLITDGCKTSDNDLNLTLTTTRWYLESDNNGFGFIMLYISGNTSGERVTVLTAGDGLLNELELTLDEKKRFQETVTIAFSHEGYTPPVQAETRVRAYGEEDYIEIQLDSGDIW